MATTQRRKQGEEKSLLEVAIDTVAFDANRVWEAVTNGTSLPQPLIKYKGYDLIYKNSIVLIQGKSATHKSRLAAAMATTLITPKIDYELIGLSKGTPEITHVMYVDTERNLFHQLPEALKQILHDAQLPNSLGPELATIPLTRVPRTERLNTFRNYLSKMKKRAKYKHVHIAVFLDVVTDCITDFNNLRESFELIDSLNTQINTQSATFFCLIHENPNVEKGRGHLGTELFNKASTVFQIAETKQEGIFQIKILKSRITKKYSRIFVRYEETTRNLVEVTDQSELSKLRNPLFEEIIELVREKVIDEVSKAELWDLVFENITISPRALENHIKSIITDKVPFQTNKGVGYLTKLPGKPLKYKMDYSKC